MDTALVAPLTTPEVPVTAPSPRVAVASPPVDAAPPMPGTLDLILRGQAQLTRLLLDDRTLPMTVQRLLVLSLFGLGIYGLVVGFAMQALETRLPWGGTLGHPLLWMPLALILAFVGGLCVCLPSFYFYTQLAGLDASFRVVTAQALRALATTAILLLGVTPFYAALVLGSVAGAIDAAPPVVLGGVAMPFLVGLYGQRTLYRSFGEIVTLVPITHTRRGAFLKRMILCWSALYTAIAPVALVRLAQVFAAHL